MEYGKRRLNQNTTNQKIYQSDKKEVVSDLESLTASIDSSFQKSVPNVPMQTDIFGMPGRLKTDNNSLFMHSHYKNGKKSTQGSYVKMQLEEAIKNLYIINKKIQCFLFDYLIDLFLFLKERIPVIKTSNS